MKKITTLCATLMLTVFGWQANAQYCAAGPSSTFDSNVESVVLTGDAATAINYTGCPGVSGLEDLTATQAVSLTAGSPYTANVQFGTCGGNYGGAGEAWIDWNQNFTFEPSESIGTWSGTPPAAITAMSFNVPALAVNGNTVMRVMQQESGSNPLNPCGTYTWGSAVDFTVTVSGGFTITCPQPTTLTGNVTSGTSATLGWTEAATATLWDIEWGATGFTQGTGTMVSAITTNPHNLTTLSSSTTYDFYVRADCGGGDQSFWSGPFSFTTPCGTVALPWSEDFSNAGTIPNCWTMAGGEIWRFNSAGTGHIGNAGTITGNSVSDGYFAWVDASGSDAPATLTSPYIDISTLTVPMISFHELSDNEGNDNSTLDVEVWDGAAWHNLATYNTNTLNGWMKREVIVSHLTFTGPAAIRFTFSEIINPGDFYDDIAIDDVTFEEGPTCPWPMQLSATNITFNSADLGWIESGSATLWDVELGVDGFTPTGTPTDAGLTSTTLNLTGLSPNTIYSFYVRADCGGGDQSTWSGPFNFTTPCDPDPIQAPYLESFEGAGFSCWTVNGTPGLNYNWLQNSGTTPSWASGPNAANTGDNYLYTEADGGTNGDSARLESPAISLTGVVNSQLSFAYHMYGADIDTLYIQINDGTGFVTVDTINGPQHTANGDDWLTKQIDISAYDGVASIQLGFLAIKAGFNGDISIDDILVAEVCAMPTSGTAADLSSSSANLSWLTSGTSATTWSIEYGPTGFVQGTGSFISGTAFNPHPLVGLTDGTDYDFYIISNCALGERSPWAGPFNFTTFITGVDENTANNAVTIFPNPNNGIFTLNVNANDVTVNVMNIQGQVILTKNNVNTNEQIDLSNNAKGIYFVTVTSQNGVSTHKVSVQ